ncbi:MAG: hypothetical protein ACYDBQ_10330 [Thermoplasmatota archaeon]
MALDIQGWHDFFLLLGGACATLVGLLFVAVTLNIERLRAAGSGSTFALAERTFGSFLVLIILSLVVLIPDLDEPALSVTLLAVGAAGLVRSLVRLAKARPTPGAARRWFVLPIAGFLLFLYAGWRAWGGDPRAMDVAAFPVFLFLVQSVSESWRLLLQFRNASEEASAGPRGGR